MIIRKEHPYLHDLFRAILIYDKDKVIEKLRELRPYWRLLKPTNEFWQFSASKSEHYLKEAKYGMGGGGFVDATWEFRTKTKLNRTCYFVHEIKTGRYTLEEIVKKYEGTTIKGTRVGTMAHNPIIIWGWEKYNILAKAECKNDIIKHHLRIGAIKQLDLEILRPLLSARIREFWEE